MRKLNFEAPFNSLSLGNVALNFARELKDKVDLEIFPVGTPDLSAYDQIPDEFISWFANLFENSLKRLDRNIPTLKLWHINGSELSIGKDQFLYTFYEVDSPTEEEVGIVKAQEHVFFSSLEATEAFESKGCKNVSHVPLGFDPDFHKVDKEFLGPDIIHFGLVGKMERRKNTIPLIKLWIKLFGNLPRFQLSCLVDNPFLNEEQVKRSFAEIFKDGPCSNVNFVPRLRTNSEVNNFINSIDVDLSGLSNGEGWNLPSFNATALGKWSIVSNCTSHTDWATDDNSILVNPIGKQPCYDDFFFKRGGKFNQGEYYRLNGSDIGAAMKASAQVAKSINTEGLKLQEEFTYEKSVDKILETIFNHKPQHITINCKDMIATEEG